MAIGEVVVDVLADMSGFQRDVEKGMSRSQSAMKNVGDKMSSAGKSMTRNVSLPLVALGGAMIKTAASFDKQMNNVAAITGATGGEFDGLRKQAIDLGASTAFSASEAAEGMQYLGQAGFDTNQIMAAMPATLDLAAASATDLGTTADIMSNILTGFGESADQSGRYANVLSKAASATNADLTDLGEAMKYVAPVANSAGYSMEETAAAVGLLSNAGIQGSMAGTTLRGTISRLLDPSKKAANVMEELGVNAVDSSGNIKPLDNIIQQLADSGATTADFMAIFGQRAGPGMAALVEQGSGALKNMTTDLEGVGKSGDYVGKQADTQMRGAAGAVEELGGAFESLSIAVADAGLIDMFTGAVKGLTSFVRVLGEADPKLLKFGIGVAGVVAAMGPLLMVTGSVVRNVATVSSAFSTLSGMLAKTKAPIPAATSSLQGFGFTATNTATQVSGAGQQMASGMDTAAGGAKRLGGVARGVAGAAGIGALTASFMSAKDEGASFGNVMTGVVGGALTGLATTGTPVGAVIGGLAGGVLPLLTGAFTKSSRASEELQNQLDKTNTKAATTMYDALKNSLNEVTGAYSGTSRAAVSAELFDKNGPKEWVTAMNEAGVSTRTLTSAIMGQPAAMEQVDAAMGSINDTIDTNKSKISDNKAEIDNYQKAMLSSTTAGKAFYQDRIDDLNKENAGIQKRNESLMKAKESYKGSYEGAKNAVEVTREQSDAANSLAKRLGISQKAAQAMTAQMSQPMAIKLREEGLSKVLTDMEGVSQVAADMRKPTNSQIKILLRAAGMDETAENVRKVRENVRSLNKTKVNMDAAVKGVQRAMGQAGTAAAKGTKDVQNKVRNGTSKAKPNLSPFMSSLAKSMKSASSQASKGASNTAKNLRNGTGKAKANLSPFMGSLSRAIGTARGSANSGGKQISSNLSKGSSQAKANLSGLQASIRIQAAAAGAIAATGGSQIGSSLTSGVQGAINASAGSVAAAAASMVTRAIGAAKAAAKSKSPSKVTYKLGLDIDEGLRLGIVKGGASVTRAGWQLTSNLLKQISKGTEVSKYFGRATDAIAKQYEGRVDAAEKSAARRMKNIDVLEKRWKKSGKKLTAGEAANLKRRRAYTNKLLANQKKAAATSKRNQDRAVAWNQKYFTRIQNQYNNHLNKLTELRKSRAEMISGMRESFLGEVDLSVTGGSFDVAAASVSRVAAKAKQAAALTKKALAAGVPKGLVQSVLASGLDSAIPALTALTSGSKAETKKLAADYAAIDAYGKQAGTYLGNAFYNTGIAAQEGLIRGLLNNKALQRAGTSLAKKLTASVRKALGIRSPSKVMETMVGAPVGEGILVGAEKAVGAGVTALSRTVSGGVTPLTSGSSTPAPAVATSTGKVQVAGPTITQVFTGPTTSGGRLKELDWTTRYATKARNERYGGVAR